VEVKQHPVDSLNYSLTMSIFRIKSLNTILCEITVKYITQ